MTTNADKPVAQVIDALLNELAALSEDPNTKAAEFFEKITVTIDSLFAPKYFAVVAVGPNNENTFVHGSKSLAQFAQIPEMAKGSSFAKFLAKADTQIGVLGANSDQRIVARIELEDGVWGGLFARFEQSTNVGPIVPIFDAIREITKQFVRHQAERRNANFLQQFLRFSFNSHSSLNPKLVANHVANDARLMLGCERLTILGTSRTRSRVLAVSSVSSLENRSALASKLTRLVDLASRNREPFFTDQPPNSKSLNMALESFKEVSGFDFVMGIPLIDQSKKNSKVPPVIGFLVAESAKDVNRFDFTRALKVTAPHISLALSNAQAVARIPFRRTLSVIGKLQKVSNVLSLLAVLTLLFLLVFSLFYVKSDFKIRLNGELRPTLERNVFAPADGFVEKVFVNHGEPVNEDQVLIELSSPSLELELKQLNGDQLTIEKKLETKKIALNQAASGNLRDPAITGKLAAEISELEFELANLADKEAFLNERIAELVVLSPIDGVITNWQLKNSILKKPVRWGEELANIAFEAGEWQINFKVPEYRIGYLLDARGESNEPLEIEFFFESNPTKRMRTQIREISPSTELDAEFGPTVTVVCDVAGGGEFEFEKRHGARVIADVTCGKKSIFASFTQEFIDSIRRRIVW